MRAYGLDPDVTKDSGVVPHPHLRFASAPRSSIMRGLGSEKKSSRWTPYERYGSCGRSSRWTARASLRDDGPVVRPDDAIGQEDPLERQARVPTARDRVVPVADAVVDGPGTQERDSGEDEDRRRNEPCPPGSTHEQRDHRQHEQHLIARPHGAEEGDAQPYEREASRRR